MKVKANEIDDICARIDAGEFTEVTDKQMDALIARDRDDVSAVAPNGSNFIAYKAFPCVQILQTDAGYVWQTTISKSDRGYVCIEDQTAITPKQLSPKDAAEFARAAYHALAAPKMLLKEIDDNGKVTILECVRA